MIKRCTHMRTRTMYIYAIRVEVVFYRCDWGWYSGVGSAQPSSRNGGPCCFVDDDDDGGVKSILATAVAALAAALATGCGISTTSGLGRFVVHKWRCRDPAPFDYLLPYDSWVSSLSRGYTDYQSWGAMETERMLKLWLFDRIPPLACLLISALRNTPNVDFSLSIGAESPWPL